MTKNRSPRARLLSLMSTVEWQGVSSWQDMREQHQTEQIELFLAWLKDRVQYLPHANHTEDFKDYYLDNATFKVNASNRTRDMNRCRDALYTLHKWERKNG